MLCLEVVCAGGKKVCVCSAPRVFEAESLETQKGTDSGQKLCAEPRCVCVGVCVCVCVCVSISKNTSQIMTSLVSCIAATLCHVHCRTVEKAKVAVEK
jgi:hypothetical protein